MKPIEDVFTTAFLDFRKNKFLNNVLFCEKRIICCGCGISTAPLYFYFQIRQPTDMAEPFNTYTLGLDLQFVHELCEREGETVDFQKEQLLEREGEPARWVGFVEQRCGRVQGGL